MKKKRPLTLVCSVKQIAHQTHKSGGLGGTGFLLDRALEGTRVHQAVQKSRGESYQPEVTLKLEWALGPWIFKLSGRADGILNDYKNCTLIEEIKSTWGQSPKEPQPIDLAQAKLYAAMHALSNDLEVIGIRMTYVRLEDQKSLEFESKYSQNELKSFLEATLRKFGELQQNQVNHIGHRNQSLKELDFPFPFRDGQHKMAGECYLCIKNRSKLFLMAPTGMGKTLGTLFSCLKAMAKGKTDRTLYLTAKTTGKLEVMKAGVTLLKTGGIFRILTLTAKEKSCINPEMFCDQHVCQYATSFYDHLPQCLEKILKSNTFLNLSPDCLTQLAEEFQVCPHYLGRELLPFVDVIVGDFNHAYNPGVKLGDLFEDPNRKTTLLVDEAHNLPGRARHMFSASLTKLQILAFRRAVKQNHPAISKSLSRLNSLFLNVRKNLEKSHQPIQVQKCHPPELLSHLEHCLNQLEKALAMETRTR